MPDDELKILLHDYFDELLTHEEESDFQTLLMENRSLAIELGKLKDLKRKLKNMPLSFEPPPKIINNITEKLLKLDNVKEEKKLKENKSAKKAVKVEKKKKRTTVKFLLQVFMVLIILLLGGGGGYYYFYIYQSTAPWRVTSTSGDFKIDNRIQSINQISEHQTFELSEDGEAEIYMKDQGVIDAKGKTKLDILSALTDQNSISFIYGNIEYIPKPTSGKFQIVKGELVITSENSKFRIFSDELGDFNLEILSNFLEVEFKNENYRFAHDYVVKIEADNVIRTPYSNKTTPIFIKLLTDYDYNHDVLILGKIIDSAAKNDALTLHFLLSQVAPAKRELIIDKLKSIIPLPFGVNYSDILILNKEMMNKWWDEIYSTIY